MMATTAIWRVKGYLGKVLLYAENPEKTTEPKIIKTPKQSNLNALEDVISYAGREEATKERRLVSGINCTPESAREDMMNTKREFKKLDGVIAYHGYQSFAEGEVTPKLAHQIGKQLAEELWGDRYEVLVATHVDKKSHIHNHFVVNTVSFVDGKKYHRTKIDYQRMREISDSLCREAKLSVIDYPYGKKKHYSEWSAEKNGKPTMRGNIRKDIDRAILASITEREFLQCMRQMGYEILTRTKSGGYRTHPVVRIVDGDRHFRLDTLGEYYELDSIKQRIHNNYRRRDPFPEVPEDTKAPYYHYKEKAHRTTGLQALYYYYCYQLHIFKEKPTSVKRASAFLREDVLKLDKYIAQADFLAATGMTTAEELEACKAEQETELVRLGKKRTALKNDLRRYQRSCENDEVSKVKGQIEALSAQMKECRKKAGLCADILERSEKIRESLEPDTEQKEGKENTEDELFIRRSGRTDREDDTQRC